MTTDAPATEVEQTGDSQSGCKATTTALGEQTALDLFKTADLKFEPTSSTASQWLNSVGFTNLDGLANCGKIQDLMAPNVTGDRGDANVHLVADRGDKLKDANIPSDTVQEFSEKYGVDVKERIVNGKKEYVYQYKADGKTITAATSDASPEGLERAAKEIERKTKAEMQRLEREFGVKIPGPGEVIGPQIDSCTGEEKGEVKTRLPTLAELAGVRDALQKSRPSNQPMDGKPLHIYFADKPYEVDSNGEDAGPMYHTTIKDNPSIIIGSETRFDIPEMTDKDFEKGTSIEEINKTNSFSSMFQHEMGHHTHYNNDHDLGVPEEMLPSMGMERIKNPDNPSEFVDAVRTKDGKLYMFLPNEGGACNVDGAGKWYRINERGQTLDKNGQVLDIGEDVSKLKDLDSLSSAQLRAQALKPPSTDYFDNPKELIAEAIKNFRRNPESRQALKDSNPTLYKIAKEMHEADVARTRRR
jgi:hypothetical protein